MTYFHLPLLHHSAAGTYTQVGEGTQSPPPARQPKKGSARTVPWPKGTFPNQRSPKPSLLVSVSADGQDGRAHTSWGWRGSRVAEGFAGGFLVLPENSPGCRVPRHSRLRTGAASSEMPTRRTRSDLPKEGKADPAAVWVCAQAGISFTQQVSGERAWPLQCPDGAGQTPRGRVGQGCGMPRGTSRGTPTAHPGQHPGTPGAPRSQPRHPKVAQGPQGDAACCAWPSTTYGAETGVLGSTGGYQRG